MKGIASDNLVYLNKPIEGIVAYHGLRLVVHQENVQYNFGQLSQLSKVVKLLKLCKL